MKAGSTPWYHSGQGLGRDSGILLENLFSPGLLLHSRGKTRMNTPRKAGLRKGTPEGGSFRCCIFFSGVCPPNTSLHSVLSDPGKNERRHLGSRSSIRAHATSNL
ncbi:uncharacterized protein LOC144321967 isoform X2 [Canis aureus]